MGDVNSLITIESWKNQQRNAGEVELNKALTLLGFGAWSSLEPSKNNVCYLQYPFKFSYLYCFPILLTMYTS